MLFLSLERFLNKPKKIIYKRQTCRNEITPNKSSFENNLLIFEPISPIPFAMPDNTNIPVISDKLSVCNTNSGIWCQSFIDNLPENNLVLTLCNTNSNEWCQSQIKDL